MPLWIYQGGAELMGVRGVHGGGGEKGGGSEASSLLRFPCCAEPLSVIPPFTTKCRSAAVTR